MDFGFLTSVLGLITSVITLTIWSWWLVKKLSAQLDLARAGAAEEQAFAEELVSSATNSEKRADIYLYLTLQALEHLERRSASSSRNGITAIVALVLMFMFLWMTKTLDVDYKHPAMIVLYVTFPISLISFGAVLWFEQMLKMLEESWRSGVQKSLQSRINKHAPKP